MCALDLDRCRHGHTAGGSCPVCDIDWTKVDPRAPLFRCSACGGLYLDNDRDTHAATHTTREEAST